MRSGTLSGALASAGIPGSKRERVASLAPAVQPSAVVLSGTAFLFLLFESTSPFEDLKEARGVQCLTQAARQAGVASSPGHVASPN